MPDAATPTVGDRRGVSAALALNDAFPLGPADRRTWPAIRSWARHREEIAEWRGQTSERCTIALRRLRGRHVVLEVIDYDNTASRWVTRAHT
jgi:hypothetical protein